MNPRPRVFQYERRGQRPLPARHFARRMLGHILLVLALTGASLLGGMAGYVHYERLSWVDAYINAAMLLGGMGPVNMPVTAAGKLFAGSYALYAGLLFLVCASIVIAPVVHRVMHRMHVDDQSENS